MRSVPFDCPPNVFPQAFKGNVVLAVADALGPETLTVWLLFKIKEGSTVDMFGVSAEGKDMPPDIEAAKPVVVALATRDVWNLLVQNEEEFYHRVADAKVHISGDYRIFGRYALSLLRAIRVTKLWERFDDVANQVASNN